MNAFLYADDLLLLSITIIDLEKMLLICKDEFDWLNIAVNVKKSSCLRIGNRHNVSTANICIGNNIILWCNEFCYLGLTILLDINIITACQFYCGQLPLDYIIDWRTLKYYSKLSLFDYNSSACILFKWFGVEELSVITATYGILNTDSLNMYNIKIWNSFKIVASTLL